MSTAPPSAGRTQTTRPRHDEPAASDEQAADTAATEPDNKPAPTGNPERYHFPTAADARAKLATVLPTAANIHLHVIMTDRTLLGVCDEPAELIGYGPIPADVARTLAAADLGPKATTWLRQFYTDPDTGQLAATESKARRFPRPCKSSCWSATGPAAPRTATPPAATTTTNATTPEVVPPAWATGN